MIDERLDARLKDQRLIEVETAQKIVARVGEWTKLFGFFIAFPLGILVIVLTILGVRQYSDFVGMVDSRKEDLTRQLDAIKSEFSSAAAAGTAAKTEGDKLNQEIGEIRKALDLTQAARLRKELEDLSERVTGIERRFTINRAGMSSALERTFTSSLARFADYMEQIGFDPKRAPATVTIEKGDDQNNWYDPDQKTVFIGGGMVKLPDSSMVLWPYAQHLLTIANEIVVRTVEGPAEALSNGVPDYFVASHLNDPRVGKGYPGEKKGYLRTADNDLKFARNLEAHDAGQVWAGAFWRIRQAAGQSVADRLVYTMWTSLRQSDLADRSGAGVARQLIAAADKIDGGVHVARVRTILEARGLKF